MMANMKKELSVISPLVACEIFNTSITTFFMENYKTLPNKIMAEQAYDLFKDMYLLPNLEKLIIDEIKTWLLTYSSDKSGASSTTSNYRQLHGPLSEVMSLSNFNMLINYFVEKANRKHFISFVSALENVIWESGVIQYQVEPHFVFDRIIERFTGITSLFIQYVYKGS
jgi:hypothetical protein